MLSGGRVLIVLRIQQKQVALVGKGSANQSLIG